MCWCGLMTNNSVSQAGPPSKQRVLSLQGSNGWSQDFVGGCIHHWLVRTSLFLSVTVVIPSSFAASSPVQQSTHNTGNEKEAHLLYNAWLRKHSRRLSSSYALPTVREEWAAQDVPRTNLKSWAHPTLLCHYLAWNIMLLAYCLPACSHVCWAVQISKEVCCIQSEMKTIVCFLEAVT